MLATEQRLAINTEEVAAEVIDGEAVLINLGTGMYYTLDKVGALVWQLIEAGHSVGEMSSMLADRYQIEHHGILRDLEHIINELMEERLIVTSDRPAVDAAPVEDPGIAETYERPVLHKYTDMAEVLALDPPLPELRETTWKKPC